MNLRFVQFPRLYKLGLTVEYGWNSGKMWCKKKKQRYSTDKTIFME
jgi:hypothetical protein